MQAFSDNLRIQLQRITQRFSVLLISLQPTEMFPQEREIPFNLWIHLKRCHRSTY